MLRGRRDDAAFLAAGLLATVAQVLLLRELMTDVAGDETAIGIGLAAWFSGVGVGAALARRCARARHAAASLALLAVLPVAGIVLGRLLRSALAPDPGELPGVALTLGLALATLAPAGVAVGSAFTALAAGTEQARRGLAVTRLYVVESLGSLAGGLLVTWLAGVHLLPLRLAALTGAAAGALALAGLARARRALVFASLLCGAALLTAGPLDRWSEAVRFSSVAGGVPLLASVDTPYQHLAVGGDAVRHLYANGQYVGSFPDPYAAETLGNLVALLAPSPRRVLLVGGVERGLVPVLLRHGVDRLTLLEPDAGALAFLGPMLPQEDRAALHDRRVYVAASDPRAWLAAGGEALDLVVLLGPDPTTLWRARLTTVEFYRLVARRLAPQGVLVASLPSAPVLAGETEALAGALLRTLREALPVVRATPGPDALMVASWSASSVTLDPAALATRWRARGVSSASFDAAVLPALLPPERVAAQQAALDVAARDAPPSRDDRPASFLRALARRQQVVSGRAGRLLALALGLPPGGFVLLALLPSLSALASLRARTAAATARAAATHAVAATGAAGLGWSLVLLFSFQAHAGALYGLLGALVAAFMLGLAIGGALAAGMRAAGTGPAGLPGAARGLRDWLLAAAVFSGSLPLALVAAARAAEHGTAAALAAHGGLLLVAGLVTGGLFPLTVELRLAAGDTVVEAAGAVEAADHAGAAAGALCGAVLFVPLVGLARSALLLCALLSLAACAVAWAERRAAKTDGWRRNTK